MTYSTTRSNTFKQALEPVLRGGYADIILPPMFGKTAIVSLPLGVFLGLGQFISSPDSHFVEFEQNGDRTWTANTGSTSLRIYLRMYFRVIGDKAAHRYLDDPNYFADVEYAQRDRWNTLHRKSRTAPPEDGGHRAGRYKLCVTDKNPLTALQTLQAETRAYFLALVARVQAKAHS